MDDRPIVWGLSRTSLLQNTSSACVPTAPVRLPVRTTLRVKIRLAKNALRKVGTP